jgi:hypothetical protein
MEVLCQTQWITYWNRHGRSMHRVQHIVKNSPILMIIVDPLDEKIIMTEIVSSVAVERKSQHWYVSLNRRHDLVRKSLNI